jgi:hypothetical protein
MRAAFQILLAVAVAGVFTLGATQAKADANVFAQFAKWKVKTVDEDINIRKDIDLTINEQIFVDGAAEQEVVSNQRNQWNFVEDENGLSAASIDGATGDNGNGIFLINQAPGFTNNQANEVSVTLVESPFDGAFVHAQDAVEQINGWNPPNILITFPDDTGQIGHREPIVVVTDTVPPDFDLDGFPDFVNQYIVVFGNVTSDDIVDSFNDGSGIIGINQSAGSINNQVNSAAIALADFATFALGEIDLGQFNTWNLVDVIDTIRTDTITNSFNGFDGIVMVNQSAGAINNQANKIDIGASIGALGFQGPVLGGL